MSTNGISVRKPQPGLDDGSSDRASEGEGDVTSDGPLFDVEITNAALDTIRNEVHRGGTDLETGGILLGHEHATGYRIIVAGGPGPNAIRIPLSCSRDLTYTQALADAAWDEHRAVWLGEWHTHPAVPPVPSGTDMASYAAHLADPELGFARIISVIVGLVPGWVSDSGQAAVTDHQPEGPAEDRPVSYDGRASNGVTLVVVAWVVDHSGATVAPLQPIRDQQ